MSLSIVKIGASSLIALSMISVATPSFAHRGHYNDYYSQDRSYYYNDDRGYRNDRDYRREADYNREQGYRSSQCDKGTGGTIIGAIAGGLLGHEVVGRRGDKTAGVIIGAGVGALAGRAIDRAGNRRC
ncbi:MAG: glycine zipper 2TM domain-containing protein [Sphingomonadaceae bacterium]